jgi:RNA polymerase sigma-70 factor (ECF subfamily)
MDAADQDLLRSYRSGQTAALGQLVERYKRPLFRYILNMTRPGEADEVFQETWFRAIRKMDTCRDENLLGWLMRICHNLVIDRARVSKRTVSLDGARSGDGDDPAPDTLQSPGPGPAGLVEARDLGERIRAAVRALPDDQREVFLLRTDAEVPFKEIARIQGVSIGTALARMRYAVLKLRAALGAEYAGIGGGA